MNGAVVGLLRGPGRPRDSNLNDAACQAAQGPDRLPECVGMGIVRGIDVARYAHVLSRGQGPRAGEHACLGTIWDTFLYPKTLSLSGCSVILHAIGKSVPIFSSVVYPLTR